MCVSACCAARVCARACVPVVFVCRRMCVHVLVHCHLCIRQPHYSHSEEYHSESSRGSDLSDILEEDEEELYSEMQLNDEGRRRSSHHALKVQVTALLPANICDLDSKASVVLVTFHGHFPSSRLVFVSVAA